MDPLASETIPIAISVDGLRKSYGDIDDLDIEHSGGRRARLASEATGSGDKTPV